MTKRRSEVPYLVQLGHNWEQTIISKNTKLDILPWQFVWTARIVRINIFDESAIGSPIIKKICWWSSIMHVIFASMQQLLLQCYVWLAAVEWFEINESGNHNPTTWQVESLKWRCSTIMFGQSVVSGYYDDEECKLCQFTSSMKSINTKLDMLPWQFVWTARIVRINIFDESAIGSPIIKKILLTKQHNARYIRQHAAKKIGIVGYWATLVLTIRTTVLLK